MEGLNSSYLKLQIDEREAKRRREAQEKYLLAKQMQRMERIHQRKLNQQAGTAREYFPLKHTQWYS